MPAKLDNEDRSQIVKLRALDYNKTEIGNQIGVSRQTVTKHLEEIRNEAEAEGDAELVLSKYIQGSDVEDRLVKLEHKLKKLEDSSKIE